MTSIAWAFVNSVAILSLSTLIAVYFRRKSSAEIDKKTAEAERKADNKELEEWRASVDRQMAVLLTQVSPLWAALQTKVAKDLTHPSEQFHEMDELLRRLEALTITDVERERLRVLLLERSTSQDPEVSEEERESAKLMIGIMKKVLDEAQNEAPVADLQVVGSKPGPETKG